MGACGAKPAAAGDGDREAALVEMRAAVAREFSHAHELALSALRDSYECQITTLKAEKAALAAAKKGDASTAQAAVRDFVARGQITELDRVPGSYYNAKCAPDVEIVIAAA